MESFFMMWYNFLTEIFSTTGATITTETQSFINMVITIGAVAGVILTFAICYKIVKYIFFAILSLGR